LIPKKGLLGVIAIIVIIALLGGYLQPLQLHGETQTEFFMISSPSDNTYYTASIVGTALIRDITEVPSDGTLNLQYFIACIDESITPTFVGSWIVGNFHGSLLVRQGTLTLQSYDFISGVEFTEHGQGDYIDDRTINIADYGVSDGEQLTFQYSLYATSWDKANPQYNDEMNRADFGIITIDIIEAVAVDTIIDPDTDTTTGTATIIVKADGVLQSGSTVTLNGVTRVTAAGGTATFTELPQGSYTYLVEKDGYGDIEGTITITSGQTTTITVDLVDGSTPDPDGYTWSDYGYIAALGGIIAAAVIFAIVPAPPKIKGFLSIAIALGGFVVAHLFNTGVL